MTSEGLFNEINVSLKNAIVDSTAKLYAAYELSLSDVERINKNFQCYLSINDIVCVVSNSVVNIGKSGAVFTKEGFYYKNWMSFDINFEYYHNCYNLSKFYKIFDNNQLSFVMSQANNYIVKCTRKEMRINSLKKVLKIDSDVSMDDIISLARKSCVDIYQNIFQRVSIEKNIASLLNDVTMEFCLDNFFKEYLVSTQSVIQEENAAGIFLNKINDEINKLNELAVSNPSEYIAKVLIVSFFVEMLSLKAMQDYAANKAGDMNVGDLHMFMSFKNMDIDIVLQYQKEWHNCEREDEDLIEIGNQLIGMFRNTINESISHYFFNRMLVAAEQTEYVEAMEYCYTQEKIVGKKQSQRIKKLLACCNKNLAEIDSSANAKKVKLFCQCSKMDVIFLKKLSWEIQRSDISCEYPIVNIVLSKYFSSGIAISNKNIYFNYLPFSPEISLICNFRNYDEDRRKELLSAGINGIINLSDVSTLEYFENEGCFNFLVKLNNGEKYYLPVTVLEKYLSKTITNFLHNILKIFYGKKCAVLRANLTNTNNLSKLDKCAAKKEHVNSNNLEKKSNIKLIIKKLVFGAQWMLCFIYLLFGIVLASTDKTFYAGLCMLGGCLTLCPIIFKKKLVKTRVFLALILLIFGLSIG